MLYRTLRLLSRPKGPPGQRPGKEYRLTMPYRTEVTMMRECNVKRFNSNVRELYKKPLAKNNMMAIPRDLGELPRNYVLKLLLLNQPIRLVDLWEVCKQQSDVPLDSSKHLRLVLKIASVQKWVYTEKNQSNNLYYYYVHQSRAQEVQAMIRADEAARKAREFEDDTAAARQAREAATMAEQQRDDSIVALQNLLVSNVARMRTFDPAYVDSLPYVTPGGAVNCAWYCNPSHGGSPDSAASS